MYWGQGLESGDLVQEGGALDWASVVEMEVEKEAEVELTDLVTRCRGKKDLQ